MVAGFIFVNAPARAIDTVKIIAAIASTFFKDEAMTLLFDISAPNFRPQFHKISDFYKNSHQIVLTLIEHTCMQ